MLLCLNSPVEDSYSRAETDPKSGGRLMAIGCNLEEKANNLQKSFCRILFQQML